MLRRLIVILFVLLVSGQAFAQTTLPTVVVTGVRVSDGTYLCNSPVHCQTLLSSPLVMDLQNATLSDLVQEEEDRPECSSDETTRETAVWNIYKALMIARHGNVVNAALADKRFQDQGGSITIEFADGSSGTYVRTDSPFPTGSHGFFETKAPDCAG